jgi:hypothetical protein
LAEQRDFGEECEWLVPGSQRLLRTTFLANVSPAFLAEFPDAFPESGLEGWFAIIRRKG